MRTTQKLGVARFNIRQITVVGILTAITVILGQFGIGFFYIPGWPAKITIMHIPVIIGAVLEGPLVGAMVGLLFGIFSIIQNVMVPTPLSFAFMNPLVSVLPRILIGITAYYSYNLIRIRSEAVRIGIAAAIGTATNTVGVLGMIYLLYAEPYVKAIGKDVTKAGQAIAAIGATNGIGEIVAAVVIVTAVVTSIKQLMKRSR